MKAIKLSGIVICLGIALGVPQMASASLSQGFNVQADITAGSLVSLDEKTSGSVVTTDLNNASRLFGVVVPPSSASISLSSGGTNKQVQVASSGTVSVLVTNASGDIRLGDYLTISPVAGVAQKVGDSSARVIGIAQADFTADASGTTKRSINLGTGSKEVVIGQIPVAVSVSTYTSTDGKQAYAIPTWLQTFSNNLAGKAVSPVRIIVAGIILLVSLVSVTVLLYAAVRNSIISIGRNPLSRSSVLRGLLEVMAIVAGILAITAVAMYLVIAR